MLLNELNKIIKRSVSLIINWSGFIWLEKSDGWETSDRHHWVFILSGIHLSNDNISVALDLLSQLDVNWLKFLAVTAPRSIGLNEDEFVSSQNDGLESLSDDNLDWLVVTGWDWGRFMMDLELVVFEVLERLNKTLLGKVVDDKLVESSVVELDVSGGWSRLDSDVISQSLSESFRDLRDAENESFSIVDVLLGKLLESSGAVRIEVVIKEEQSLSLLSEDSIGSLLVELTDNWVSMGIDELLDGFRGNSLSQIQGLDSIIERSEHDKTEVTVELNLDVTLTASESTVD